MKIRNVQMVDVQDWDDLVSRTYGRRYSFQQQDDCRQRGTFELTVPDQAVDFPRDSVPEIVNHPTMGVSFKAWLERDPKKPLDGQQHSFELDLWWDRNFYPAINMVANDLHARGLLAAGTYVIDIDW